VRLAYQFAIENDLIRADGIEVAEFPDVAGKYRVYAVPKTVINEAASVEGSLPEEFFLDEVMKVVGSAETDDADSSSA
jgi:hypothetical protein